MAFWTVTLLPSSAVGRRSGEEGIQTLFRALLSPGSVMSQQPSQAPNVDPLPQAVHWGFVVQIEIIDIKPTEITFDF
jgi:hypothetical protein